MRLIAASALFALAVFPPASNLRAQERQPDLPVPDDVAFHLIGDRKTGDLPISCYRFLNSGEFSYRDSGNFSDHADRHGSLPPDAPTIRERTRPL